MGKISGLLIAGLSCMLLLSTDSCRKSEDLRLALEDGDADLGQCNIRQLTLNHSYPPAPNQVATFTYNRNNDPVSIMHLDFLNPGFSQTLFSYDIKSRLSEVVTLRSNNTFDTWHIYFYDGNSRITGDSMYADGIAGQKSSARFVRFSQIFYDRLHRVVKEIVTTPIQVAIQLYDYNADGNLSNVPNIPNQLNIFLTNKIWRFIARDYSINGHSAASSVNEHGLPTAFAGTAEFDIATFFFGDEDVLGLDIEYACDGEMRK